ncbi:hypothetical protein AB0O01_35100 [Streptomyces sp. NPDC093252]|uniref:hypothetical protein n=1 Tax=Streptomyces sp. NPDC093252 TaxID=3154980 RepID=UPI003431C0B9
MSDDGHHAVRTALDAVADAVGRLTAVLDEASGERDTAYAAVRELLRSPAGSTHPATPSESPPAAPAAPADPLSAALARLLAAAKVVERHREELHARLAANLALDARLTALRTEYTAALPRDEEEEALAAHERLTAETADLERRRALVGQLPALRETVAALRAELAALDAADARETEEESTALEELGTTAQELRDRVELLNSALEPELRSRVEHTTDLLLTRARLVEQLNEKHKQRRALEDEVQDYEERFTRTREDVDRTVQDLRARARADRELATAVAAAHPHPDASDVLDRLARCARELDRIDEALRRLLAARATATRVLRLADRSDRPDRPARTDGTTPEPI